MRFLDEFVARRGGIFLLLFVAAVLEVWGDSFFQSAVHRSSGFSRWVSITAGAAVLAAYGLVVNLPGWEFGKLLGIYVFFFYVAAQLIGWMRFKQPITLPVMVGALLIAAGGAVITFWKR